MGWWDSDGDNLLDPVDPEPNQAQQPEQPEQSEEEISPSNTIFIPMVGD